MRAVFFLWVTLLFASCSPRFSDEYWEQYRYLGSIREESHLYPQFCGKEHYYLVVLVDARHLDYSSPEKYFSTLGHGLFFSQEPLTGHAWIVLAGIRDGKSVVFEGGHTGEFGTVAPKYFDEVIRLSREENDPNPAKYLFTMLPDGRLEPGAGGHTPTFAAAFPLTQEGYERLNGLLQTYDFSRWSLTGPNCVRFARTCLSAIGVDIECRMTMTLPRSFRYGAMTVRLWSDTCYSSLTAETPEMLEFQLWELVKNGSALVAKKWYKSRE